MPRGTTRLSEQLKIRIIEKDKDIYICRGIIAIGRRVSRFTVYPRNYTTTNIVSKINVRLSNRNILRGRELESLKNRLRDILRGRIIDSRSENDY